MLTKPLLAALATKDEQLLLWRRYRHRENT
jgi:hypothetical protein